jgi:predicted RNase H-like HicB family nuclease
MHEPARYTVIVRFGEFDSETCYEARVKELPDIVEYADSYQEVYELALDSIATTAQLLEEQGREMPLPTAGA